MFLACYQKLAWMEFAAKASVVDVKLYSRFTSAACVLLGQIVTSISNQHLVLRAWQYDKKCKYAGDTSYITVIYTFYSPTVCVADVGKMKVKKCYYSCAVDCVTPPKDQ